MSAHMVNNRTLTKIAKYMAACANYRNGMYPGLSELEFRETGLLEDKGLADKVSGAFSASLIHAYLYRKNREALVARYGQEATDTEMCPNETEPMDDGGTAIDIDKVTRKEWLSNLYTVCRCYLYQIEEGHYRDDDFYWALNGWANQMAKVLAGYVVAEYRPYPPNPNFKPWDQF